MLVTIRHQKRIKKLIYYRYAVWGIPEKCKSGSFRHGVCVFGMEDIPELIKVPQFFINKMRSEYDYGAISCWARWLSSKETYTGEYANGLDIYKNSQKVRFNDNREYWRTNLNAFKC